MEAAISEGWDVLHARFDGGAKDLCADDLPPNCATADWLGSQAALCEQSRPGFVRALADLENRFSPHVVHAGPVPTVGSVAAAACSAPVIAMSWASDLLLDTYRSDLIRDRAAETLTRAAAVIVDCDAVGRRALELGADNSRLVTVPWGVDLATWALADIWPDATQPLHVLSLRSHEQVYDIETLLEAVSIAVRHLAVDVLLDIAGSGSLERSLRILSEDLGIADLITWHGRVPESQVQRLLRRCHVHVSTSLCDGSSISLLQAMATGRPSIATDIPSNREWIDHGLNGWLANPGDPHSFATILRDVREPACLLREAGQRARAIAEAKADWSRNKTLVTACYERFSFGSVAT